MTDDTQEFRPYAIEWNGEDDYLPDRALARIGELLDRLPPDGFDVPSVQANTKGVVASIHFDGQRGPLAHAEMFDAMLQAVTIVRTLHANLVAARAVLGPQP